MELDFYTVKDDYIKFLRKFDSKVTKNKSENDVYEEEKIYIGILIEINSVKYIAPLTSDKDNKLKNKKENTTFMKIMVKGKYKGSVNINNMIPVNDTVIEKVIIDDIRPRKPLYADLLNIQLSFLKANDNDNKLKNKAKTLHNIILKNTNEKYSKISCDFELLEEKCIEFE